MWPFSNTQKIERSGVLQNFTDWHCHILPGVDDGVQTPAESLRILERYEQAGIREVWFTPHIMEDIPNTNERLTQRFDELRAAYNGSLRLHLAAEAPVLDVGELRAFRPFRFGGDAEVHGHARPVEAWQGHGL